MNLISVGGQTAHDSARPKRRHTHLRELGREGLGGGGPGQVGQTDRETCRHHRATTLQCELMGSRFSPVSLGWDRSWDAERAGGLGTQRWRGTGWFGVAEQVKVVVNCSLLIPGSPLLPAFPALERRRHSQRQQGPRDNFTAALVFADFPWRRVTQLVVPLPLFVKSHF